MCVVGGCSADRPRASLVTPAISVSSCDESLKIMKGPGQQFDLRALRVFRCRSCGRQISVPGSVTSQLCGCSDPPQFMTAIDRAAVVSPDVTAFISPADPAEVELDEAAQLEAEEAYVPYVPQIPVRPPQHPGRRKLSEDIERYQPAEFGAGLSDGVSGAESSTAESEQPDGPLQQDRGAGDRSGARDRGRQRESYRERGRRDQGSQRQQSRESGRGPTGGSHGGRDRGRMDDRGRSAARYSGDNAQSRSGERHADRDRDRRGGPRDAEQEVGFGGAALESDASSLRELTEKPPATGDEFGSGVESIDDRAGSDGGAREQGDQAEGSGKRRRRRRR